MITRKLFYSHLIDPNELVEEVVKMELEVEEREEIFDLIEEILHQRILDGLLDILPEEHHRDFAKLFSEKPEEGEVLMFVKERAKGDVEVKIIEVYEVTKREILSDVKSVKKKKAKL